MSENKHPIRVLCVFSTLDRGGAESMCMNLYRHIDRSKVQFDFVKHDNIEGDFEEEIKNLGGRIYTAPRLGITNWLAYLKWWEKHLRKHPEHTIIHGHYFTISAIYFYAAKKLNRVTIGHIHSSNPIGQKKSLLRKFMLCAIERDADWCFACSQKAGEWLYPHREFKVINNAISAERFRVSPEKRKNARKALGININALVVGTVGNYSSVKNPMATIAIFDEILKRRTDARFIWVGDGYLRKQIEEEINRRGLNKYMNLLGSRGDVDILLQAMDAFVLPSLYEGLPVVAIEAQAAGLKCFFSDTVTHEADITGRCTFLDNTDYVSWAEEICSADLEKRDTYEQIRNAGYDVSMTAKWLQDFYLRLSESKSEG